jgi:hypothetical protein
MLDCRQVKPLLALWIGQDLPDDATANDVSRHLEKCPACNQRRNELQNSVDVLQNLSAQTLSVDSHRASIWPKLMTRIAEWDKVGYRERFNGWIPATVMAVAVALMVAVSIPSLHEEFFGSQAQSTKSDELIATLPEFQFKGDANVDRPTNRFDLPSHAGHAARVVYKPEQW